MAEIRWVMMVLTVSVVVAGGVLADSHSDMIEVACRVTTYPELCVAELMPYEAEIKKSDDPDKEIVKKSGLLTLKQARELASWARRLVRGVYGPMDAAEKGALMDCSELVDDARSEAHDSLKVLKHLRQHTLESQMSDILTWLSAAVTDYETCLDGLAEVTVRTRSGATMRVRATRVQQVVDVSLALARIYAYNRGVAA